MLIARHLGEKVKSPKKGRPKKKISPDVNTEQTTEKKTARKRKLSSEPQEAAKEGTSTRKSTKRIAKTTPKKTPRKPVGRRSKSMPEESISKVVIQNESPAIDDLNLQMDDSPDKSQVHLEPTSVKRKAGRPPKVKENITKQVEVTADELNIDKDTLPEDDSGDIVVESQVEPVLNQILELADTSISHQVMLYTSYKKKSYK